MSVVVPAYNAGHYLQDALESVLCQTVRVGEIILVDDGSTDDTATTAGIYAGRVKYVHQENAGPAAARNRGIREASGKIIAFLDADDVWEPAKTERQLEFLRAHSEFAAVYSDVSEIDETGTVLVPSKLAQTSVRRREGWVLEELLLSGFILTPSVLVRRSAVEEVGAFDPRLRASEDRDFFIRLAARYPIGCVNEALVRRRRHGGNISNDFVDVMLRGDCEVLERAHSSMFLSQETRARARRHLGELYLRLARHDLARGDRGRARREFRRGLTLAGARPLDVLMAPLAYLPTRVVRGLAGLHDWWRNLSRPTSRGRRRRG